MDTAEASKVEKNWSQNLTYSSQNIFYPQNEQELAKLLLESDKQAKPLGSKHSFNHIADTKETLISTANLNRVLGIDKENSLVWVESGIKYGELGVYLDEHKYALHNLASLPHISVAGACATATHGSGDTNGNLASAVAALEIMTANGSIIKLDKNDPEFFGAVVNLGALGIVTKMALKIEPSFRVSQHVFENLPMSQLEHHFEDIYKLGYSVCHTKISSQSFYFMH
jgi:xylitol oxidase